MSLESAEFEPLERQTDNEGVCKQRGALWPKTNGDDRDGGTVNIRGLTGMAAVFGHTAGAYDLHDRKRGQQLVLGADFANHYVLVVAHPDWKVRFDNGQASRRRDAAQRVGHVGPQTYPFFHIGYTCLSRHWGFLSKRAMRVSTMLPASLPVRVWTADPESQNKRLVRQGGVTSLRVARFVLSALAVSDGKATKRAANPHPPLGYAPARDGRPDKRPVGPTHHQIGTQPRSTSPSAIGEAQAIAQGPLRRDPTQRASRSGPPTSTARQTAAADT